MESKTKAGIVILIVALAGGGIFGWYYTQPKEDYTGLLAIFLIPIPAIPTSTIYANGSTIQYSNYSIQIVTGSYVVKDKTGPLTVSWPPYVLPLGLGEIPVRNSTVIENPILTGSHQLAFINLVEDAKLTLINVTDPTLQINCFYSSELVIENSTIGTIISRNSSKITIKNSKVTSIYDADYTMLGLIQMMGKNPDIVESEIKILQNSTVSMVGIYVGADVEVSNSTITAMTMKGVHSQYPSVLTVSSNSTINMLYLSQYSISTLNNLTVTQLSMEFGAKAVAYGLNALSAIVLDVSRLTLDTSVVTQLQYGIVCYTGSSVINNFQLPVTATYENNTILINTVIPEIQKVFASVAANQSAQVTISNCIPVFPAFGFMSIFSKDSANITINNVEIGTTAYYGLTATGSSIVSILNSNFTALVYSIYINDTAEVTVNDTVINKDAYLYTMSLLRTHNATFSAKLDAKEYSRLDLENSTIYNLIIETYNQVTVTDSKTGGTALSTITQLLINILGTGSPVGNVNIANTTITVAIVSGSAVATFDTCTFTGIPTVSPGFIQGIVVYNGTVTVNAGLLVTPTGWVNYTTIINCPSYVFGNYIYGLFEVNNSGSLVVLDYHANIGVLLSGNGKATLTNTTIDIIQMLDNGKAILHNSTIQKTNYGMLIAAGNSTYEADQLTNILTLYGTGEESSDYSSGIISNSTVTYCYLIGYARLTVQTQTTVVVANVMAGMDSLTYALKIYDSTIMNLWGISWGPVTT